MNDHLAQQREIAALHKIAHLERELEQARQLISQLHDRIRVLSHQRDLAIYDGQ